MKCLFCQQNLKEKMNFLYLFKNNNTFLCEKCQYNLKLKKTKIGNFTHFYFSDYKESKEIICKIKYTLDVEKAKIFQSLLNNFFKKNNFDIITVCPTNKTRLAIRGFNHVEIILDICKIYYQNIFYQKYREKRATMTKRRTYDDFFIFEKYKELIAKSHSILIIDDILTSGKTLISLAREVKKINNNIEISFLTLAKTAPK